MSVSGEPMVRTHDKFRDNAHLFREACTHTRKQMFDANGLWFLAVKLASCLRENNKAKSLPHFHNGYWSMDDLNAWLLAHHDFRNILASVILDVV